MGSILPNEYAKVSSALSKCCFEKLTSLTLLNHGNLMQCVADCNDAAFVCCSYTMRLPFGTVSSQFDAAGILPRGTGYKEVSFVGSLLTSPKTSQVTILLSTCEPQDSEELLQISMLERSEYVSITLRCIWVSDPYIILFQHGLMRMTFVLKCHVEPQGVTQLSELQVK